MYEGDETVKTRQQKTAYEMLRSLVGSEMCIRDRPDGEEIMPLAFFVLTQYRRVTDGRTDRHVAISITRDSIASHG